MALDVRLAPTASRRYDVVGFGQNSLDLLVGVESHPAPDSSVDVTDWRELPGGEIATAMIGCARLDCRTAYVGTVGRDRQGQVVLDALRAEHVDISGVELVDAATRGAVILVDPGGGRTVLRHRDPRLSVPLTPGQLAVIEAGRVLLVDSIDPELSRTAAAAARAAGVRTVIDVDCPRPGVDELLQEVDVIIAPTAFLDAWSRGLSTGESLAKLSRETGASLVVATMGEQGALVLHEGREQTIPVCPVEVVDSTGAGDAFRAGFIASWVHAGADVSVDTLLEHASAVAALNCKAFGAQAGLPRWADVDRLVTRRPGARSN